MKGPFLVGRLIYGVGIGLRSAFVCVFKTLILGRGNSLFVVEKEKKVSVEKTKRGGQRNIERPRGKRHTRCFPNKTRLNGAAKFCY
jgi:hypothetical protein